MKNLLVKMKGLKYQKKLVITFSEHKRNSEEEYVTVYVGSNAMNIIIEENIDLVLNQIFQVVFNKTENRINAGYDWNQLMVITLILSSYIQLP